MSRPSPAFWNPYLAGLALGAVLTASFLLTGRGLGVSGLFSDLTRRLVLPDGVTPFLETPLLFEVMGLVLGAWISGSLAGRRGVTVVTGPRQLPISRLMLAAAGGVLVGVGSRFAHGCTSGQALSGGSTLSVGSWVFMITLFATATIAAQAFRKSWT